MRSVTASEDKGHSSGGYGSTSSSSSSAHPARSMSMRQKAIDSSPESDKLDTASLAHRAMSCRKVQRVQPSGPGAPVPLTTKELFGTLFREDSVHLGVAYHHTSSTSTPRPHSPHSPLSPTSISGRSSHPTSPTRRAGRRRSISHSGQNVLSARSGHTSPQRTPRRTVVVGKPNPKPPPKRSNSPPTMATKPRATSPAERIRSGACTPTGGPGGPKGTVLAMRSRSPGTIRRRSTSPGITKAATGKPLLKARARPQALEYSDVPFATVNITRPAPPVRRAGGTSPSKQGGRAPAQYTRKSSFVRLLMGQEGPGDAVQLLCTADDVLETGCVFDSDPPPPNVSSIYDLIPTPRKRPTITIPEIGKPGIAFSHNPISPMSSARDHTDSPHNSEGSTFTIDDDEGSPYLAHMKSHPMEMLLNTLRPDTHRPADQLASSPIATKTKHGPARLPPGRNMDRCLLP